MKNAEKKTTPPRWADRFLESFCSEDQLEILQGDIHELYAHRLTKMSRFKANIHYIKDVLDMLRPFAIKGRSNYNPAPMFNNYFRIALRTFARNKSPFLINLIGMSIALGCSITAFVNYQYNVDFDRQEKNAASIYRIGFWETTQKGMVPYGVAPIPVAGLIRESLREGEEVIQFMSKDGQFRIGDEMFQKQLAYAEPAFTRLFTFERLSGSLSLEDKTTILISDQLAINWFGTTNAVDKMVTQVINGEPRELTVGGVFKKFPMNSSFRFDLITGYDNYFVDPSQRSTIENNWARWATTFLFLKDKTVADRLPKQLEAYIKTQNEAKPDLKISTFYVESFVGMSHRAIKERNQGHWFGGPMPPAAVIAPFAMAGFLLLVACFNFMNNSIAIAGKRLKEIGIRKVIGGRRKELIVQFLSETMIFCFAAMIIALGLAEFFTAGWNGMWSGVEMAITYQNNIRLIVAIAALVIFTAVLAGGYPAFYISAFKPIQILKGTTRFGGASMLTKSLLVFQFSISLAAVIFALAFYYNSKFQKEYDLGYAWRSVIQVPVANEQQFEQLRNSLQNNPDILSMAGTEHHIYSSSYKVAASFENKEKREVAVLNVSDEYFDAVNVRLLAGRNFKKDQASDLNEALIVNEEFVRKFNLGEDAIGKRITFNDTTHFFITGVVKDVYLGALFEPLSPVAFRYTATNYKYLIALTHPDQLMYVNDQIKTSWSKIFPTQLYPGRPMEERMMMALEHFDSVVILYTFLGLVAIIMSISGLYSLVSLNLQKRTRELGIRKIMGAPLRHIIYQSGKLFLVVMLISFVVGTALGTVMVNAMMDSVWEYYVAVNVEIISLAVLILACIAFATIAYKIKDVVVANPVDSLRHE
ncbi:MAG: FtsX-like permease family protein [Cyclobacteriaceae bacterium]|nr:FtsX-like permease family protein [Cyclobacteriaceae bacterium]